MRAFAALILSSILLAAAPAIVRADLPDPTARGSYTPVTVDPVHLGRAALQEPNGPGGSPTAGAPSNNAANAVNLQVRGSLYYPQERASGSPVIILVHGNHGSCNSGSAPNCTIFNRNDRGYAYLGENLATWGYTVFSLDQDQLIFYQDGNYGKGMHQRRLLIAAALDALYQANQPGGIPIDADDDIGTQLVGKLDFARIGLMGHSRGGDATTSFLDWNRARPLPGRRYGIRGDIALAPVDYERRAPFGVPFLAEVGLCDGDVSNQQGARFFERSQYIDPTDPFPRIQETVMGANHNWFNSEWFVDGDDVSTADVACRTTQPDNFRLSGGTYTRPGSTRPGPDTFGSGDPALMGDQEKIGLATMSAFFRRYVGGETPFDPYMTGELSGDGVTPQLPASACPVVNTKIACFQRLQTAYFAAPQERRDVIRPDTDNPLTASALGTSITASGFANPYGTNGSLGINPVPPTTASGMDWCNPEPTQFTPSQLGITPTLPTAVKGCPLPLATALGGQSNSARESAPVNRSYGLQLALAWNGPGAQLTTRIPAASGDVSSLKSLAMGAAVNFFDTRNPARSLTDPAAGVRQDFTIALTDAAGHEGAVHAGDLRYGMALEQTTGSVTPQVHVILQQIRVPLADFAALGVDLHNVRQLQLRFGEGLEPMTGSIQLADIRFQEAVAGPTVYADSPTATGPPAVVPPGSFPSPRALIDKTPRLASSAFPDVVWLAGGASKSASGCADKLAPIAVITHQLLVGGRLRISGQAADAGCSRVKSILVKVFKHIRGGGCKFVLASGKLSKKMSCNSEMSLATKGRSSWAMRLTGKLAMGRYRSIATAVDGSGNVQTQKKVKTFTVS